ncbi:MAG: YjbE family putative metal transport protein [Rhodospirillales bacterium]|nr:YjbE family putative metal transport protein [Rhodospirillales bacterium]
MNLFSSLQFDPTMFSMIILVDIVLSGDNAIVIGMAAASLAPELRNKAIAYGIAAAILFRIPLAALTFYLLEIVGLKLIGGCLLFYVCYQLWMDLFKGVDLTPEQLLDGGEDSAVLEKADETKVASSRFLRAMITILIADLTMSLDNVLAVAGVARENLGMLVFGLVLSIALMAVGATMVAKLLNRHSWVGYIGLAVIVWVAGNLVWDGSIEVIGHFTA